MANVNVVKRPLKNGEVSYYTKHRDASGKQVMTYVGRNCSVQAKDAAADIRKQLRATGGVWQPPDATTSLRSYVLDEWLPGADLRDWTRREYRRLLEADNGLLAEIGDKPLAAVRRADVLKWMQKRAQAGASRYTIRNQFAPVAAALTQALQEEPPRIASNPCSLPKRPGGKSAIPGKAPVRVDAPPREHVERVIAGATAEFAVVLLIASSLGLRRGEIYGLKWGDFSADTRTVKVQRANVEGVIAEPKTESGVRVVPVFDRVRKALIAHRLASGFSSDTDFVFPNPIGEASNPRLLVPRALAAAIKRAGLPAKAVRFHGLRHLAVSALIAEGAPILTVSRITGHSDASITLKVYSHLLGEDLLAAADKFDPMRQVAAGVSG